VYRTRGLSLRGFVGELLESIREGPLGLLLGLEALGLARGVPEPDSPGGPTAQGSRGEVTRVTKATREELGEVTREPRRKVEGEGSGEGGRVSHTQSQSQSPSRLRSRELVLCFWSVLLAAALLGGSLLVGAIASPSAASGARGVCSPARYGGPWPARGVPLCTVSLQCEYLLLAGRVGHVPCHELCLPQHALSCTVPLICPWWFQVRSARGPGERGHVLAILVVSCCLWAMWWLAERLEAGANALRLELVAARASEESLRHAKRSSWGA